MVKFIHTADWQIEKPFSGKDPELAEKLREARFKSAENVIQLAEDEEVDFILIAGDLFEKRFPESTSRSRVYNILADENDIPVYIIAGNHDPIAPGSFYREPPFSQEDNNLYIPAGPGIFDLPGDDAILLSTPLQKKNDTNDPTDRFPEGPDDKIRIGATHGQLKIGDMWNKDGFPIDPEAVENHNLDYLALGDWHSRFVHSDRCGYSGTHEPGAYDDDAKVLTVEIEERGDTPEIEEHDVSSMTWKTLEKNLSPDGSVDELEDEIESFEGGNTLLKLSLSGTLEEFGRQRFDSLCERARQKFLELKLDVDQLHSAVSTDELLESTSNHPFLTGAIADLLRIKRLIDPDSPEEIPEGNFQKLDSDELKQILSSVREHHESLEEEHTDLTPDDIDHVLQKMNSILAEDLK